MMNAMQHSSLQQQHRRVRSLGSTNIVSTERDEDLVLFQEMQKKERATAHGTTAPTLQRAPSILPPARSKGPDDIFSSSEWDKSDYDWLMTPPATPLMPNVDHEVVGSGFSLGGAASARSILKTTSRLGLSRSEPPSRAEPCSRILRGTAAFPQQQANSMLILSTSTNSNSQRSLSSSTSAALRSTPNSSSINGYHTAPVSQPAAGRPATPTRTARRPATPTRTAGVSRVSSTSTSIRPSTPTGRSASIPSNRLSSSASGPSATISSTHPTTISSGTSSTASSRPASSSPRSARPAGPSRSSTPVKRPATPTRTANPPSTPVRSSSVTKPSVVQPKSAAASRPSSPAARSRQPATHPAVLPGFSQEPPPNLRTSMPDRPVSNSRGSLASKAVGSRAAQPEASIATARNGRLSSSPLVTRGRLSLDSLNSDKSPNRNEKLIAGPPAALHNSISTKMMDRTIPTRRPITSSQEKQQPPVASSALRKPLRSSSVREVKSTTSSTMRESSGFGRNLSKKSLDMAIRHMDIRTNTSSGFKSFMCNVPASSLYSVRSTSGRGLSSSSITGSPMATSSNASSEHSMSIGVEPEGSEMGDEMLSESGSKTSPSPMSQPDSYMALSNERRVNNWLGNPGHGASNNMDIAQVFEERIERLSSTESPLVPQYEGAIDSDNFSLETSQ